MACATEWHAVVFYHLATVVIGGSAAGSERAGLGGGQFAPTPSIIAQALSNCKKTFPPPQAGTDRGTGTGAPWWYIRWYKSAVAATDTDFTLEIPANRIPPFPPKSSFRKKTR